MRVYYHKTIMCFIHPPCGHQIYKILKEESLELTTFRSLSWHVWGDPPCLLHCRYDSHVGGGRARHALVNTRHRSVLISTAVQRRTAVTACLSSKQLLVFVFKGLSIQDQTLTQYWAR